MTKERKTFQPLKSEDIFLIYESLLKRGLVSFPITEEAKSKVSSLVFTINGSYDGKEFYKTHEEKAVAYLFFIINDHAFTDGNKRTAVLTFLSICKLNDLVPTEKYPLDTVAVFIESIREDDHHFVIKTLSGLLFE
jgi:prophage maintenance system killer protein